MNNIEWFLERIGKKVYRPIGKDDVYAAITISNEDHARQLYENQLAKNFRYKDERPVKLNMQ